MQSKVVFQGRFNSYRVGLDRTVVTNQSVVLNNDSRVIKTGADNCLRTILKDIKEDNMTEDLNNIVTKIYFCV